MKKIIYIPLLVIAFASILGYALNSDKIANYFSKKKVEQLEVKSKTANNKIDELFLSKYDSVGEFHQELAIVRSKSKLGVVSKYNGEIIPCVYDDIDLFNREYAIILTLDNKTGYADKKGKIFVYPKYEKIDYDSNDFGNGLILVKFNNKYGFINEAGKEVIACKYDFVNRFGNGKCSSGRIGRNWFLFDDKRKEIKLSEKYTDVNIFCDGMAKVRIDKKCGYIDETGKESIKPIYDYYELNGVYGDYREGYFRKEFVIVKLKEKYGVLNTKGLPIVGIKFDDIDFFPGFIRVENNKKFNVIDYEGKLVSETRYDEIGGDRECDEDQTVRVRIGKKYGFLDGKGRAFTKVKYEDIGCFWYDFAIVKLNNKYGFINSKGDLITKIIYDDVGNNSDGIAMVKLNNKFGFVNNKGNLITKIMFDTVDQPYRRLAKVKLKGKYGVIDKEGKLIVKIAYEAIELFHVDLIRLKLKGKYGFVNYKGEPVSEIKYDGADIAYDGPFFVKMNGKYGFINGKGSLMTPIKYDYVEGFEKEYALVKLNNKYGLIDKAGREIMPVIYEKYQVYKKTRY